LIQKAVINFLFPSNFKIYQAIVLILINLIRIKYGLLQPALVRNQLEDLVGHTKNHSQMPESA
jgi:hypothetical protein